MDASQAIGFVAPTLALLFACVFFAICRYQENIFFPKMLGIAFVLIAGGLGATVMLIDILPIGHAIIADTLCTLVILPVARALTYRFKVRMPWRPLLAIMGIWLATSYYLILTTPDHAIRFTMGSLVAAALLIVLLSSLRRAKHKHRIDDAIFIILSFTAAQMIVRQFSRF